MKFVCGYFCFVFCFFVLTDYINKILKQANLDLALLMKCHAVTECSCNSGVLGGAPRSSLPGEFQNLRRQ